MTDDRWPDAMRDALALVALYLEAAPDRLPDHAAYEAILLNGNPVDIAASMALAFAGLLHHLERREVIDRASATLQGLQRMYANSTPCV